MNMFLLSGDKFMPEMHLTKPEFKYSACGPLAKNRERTKKIKQKGDSRYTYQNELDKDYEDFKDLPKITASDKVLLNKAFNIAKNPKYDEYKRGLASIHAWVIPLKDKKGITINTAFQKILDWSGCKPNKIWVKNDSELYNRSMKSCLKDNGIEMYSTQNEVKFVCWKFY